MTKIKYSYYPQNILLEYLDDQYSSKIVISINITENYSLIPMELVRAPITAESVIGKTATIFRSIDIGPWSV